MKIYFVASLFVFIGICTAVARTNENNRKTMIHSMEQLQSLFKTPPVAYRSAPLWVWNDEMTEDQIDQQLQDFKSAGIGGVFIHPRPGLITAYLSDKWFSLCKYTVQKGKEMGMNVWLYDENSYPSGFAGGHVPAEMPESYNQGQGLTLQRIGQLPADADKSFIVLRKQDSKFIDITDKLDHHKNSTGDFFLYQKSYYKNMPWHGGYSYVDLLVDGVTEKFIEVTMTGYEKSIGSEFGKTVPGIFTDEPNISSPGGLRWTPALFPEFEKRWGYDLKTNLPSLAYEIGDWKQVRHNYYTTLLELFIEKWSKPWFKYCEQNNMDWTGHYWEHGWPNPHHGGDNMAMYAWHQMPAIDILMNQYSEKVNAQFGNVRAVKELSSVANQMGRQRTLSETYGAGGWELSFEDMKRIGDWQYVLGVNFLNQHLSYVTIEGARKRDHPQSFSYHAPWWKNYKPLGDYFARLSLALSAGKQVNRILVFEPTSTAWMYFSDVQSHKNFSALGPQFQEFVLSLEKNQIEYDLASENIVKDIGKISGKEFIVGERAYDTIIFPPGMENLDKSTFNLVKTYLQQGGKLFSFSDIPRFVDGRESDELKAIVDEYSTQWTRVNSVHDPQLLQRLASDKIQFHQPEQVGGTFYHHRRELANGQVLFLTNTSQDKWATGSLDMRGKSVSELDLLTGVTKPYFSTAMDGFLKISFDLPPCGSVLLLVSDSIAKTTTENQPGKINIIPPLNTVQISKTSPNVLTLDYCDLQMGGMLEKDVYFFKAADKIFKHHGFAGNPWSRAVQYKSAIVDRDTFAVGSGFEVTYSFQIDGDVERSKLQAVIEHPDLWQVSIKGKIVKQNSAQFWLDRKFGVYNIGSHAIAGKNHVKLVASPMSVHSEVEAIYILGDFNLKPLEKGWKLSKAQRLNLGSWRGQGLPFYSDRVNYSKSYAIKKSDKRFVVKLTDWRGSVAEVLINDKSAGIIAWPPYELDVTDNLANGENEVVVVVTGTLKNLLGPHHIGPVRGTAWPASFESAHENMPAGNEYDFIDYGLFEDFVLLESDGPVQKVYWRIEQAASPVFGTMDTVSINSPVRVSISSATPEADIRYTLDGSAPNKTSKIYTGPFTLKQSAAVKVCAFKDGLKPSSVVERNIYIVSEKTGLVFRYFEGNWEKLPEFESLSPLKKGRIYDFNLASLPRRASNFAVEFSGFLKIEKAGEYRFYTNSNDGSRLFIGEKIVVDNDGLHGNFERQGRINLKSGLHPIKVQYFDGGGSQALRVLYKGPGIARQVIPVDKLRFSDE